MPVDLAVIGEGQDRVRGELGSVANGARTNGASIGNSLTTVAGLPRVSNRVASSRETRAPESEVSAIRARHSRVQSSTTVKIRNRRPSIARQPL